MKRLFEQPEFPVLRRLAGIVLLFAFAFMSAGITHDDCAEGDGHEESTARVLVCTHCCHHHVITAPQPASLADEPIVTAFAIEPGTFIPDAIPTGIFRPPKHLV